VSEEQDQRLKMKKRAEALLQDMKDLTFDLFPMRSRCGKRRKVKWSTEVCDRRVSLHYAVGRDTEPLRARLL
jgi:hypothetical protein